MTHEDQEVVRAVGLVVVQADNKKLLGATTDVLVGEEGRVVVFRVKHGWLSHEHLLPARDATLAGGKLVANHTEGEENRLPSEVALMNVPVRTHGGHALGRVTNVLVEPPTFHVTGFELSSGIVKDWIRGRAVILLHTPDPMTIGVAGEIVLPDESDVVDKLPGDVRKREKPGAKEAVAPASRFNGEPAIDWVRVRDTSEENIRQEMARIVWERHGAPQNSEGGTRWLDMALPWAAELKQASENGQTDAFDDLALLSDNQVEALRPFRIEQKAKGRG